MKKQSAKVTRFLEAVHRDTKDARYNDGPKATPSQLRSHGFHRTQVNGLDVYVLTSDQENVATIILGEGKVRSLLWRVTKDRMLGSVVAGPPLTSAQLGINGVDETEQKTALPHVAEYIFYLLVRDKNNRAAMLGDLAEQYEDVLAKFGKRKADIFYWWQVCLSFGPLLWQSIARIVQIYRWFVK